MELSFIEVKLNLTSFLKFYLEDDRNFLKFAYKTRNLITSDPNLWTHPIHTLLIHIACPLILIKRILWTTNKKKKEKTRNRKKTLQLQLFFLAINVFLLPSILIHVACCEKYGWEFCNWDIKSRFHAHFYVLAVEKLSEDLNFVDLSGWGFCQKLLELKFDKCFEIIAIFHKG